MHPKKEGVAANYLKAYAKKIGTKPSDKICRSFNDFVATAAPKDWAYKGGKPYPGSVLRFNSKQIEKIKAAKNKN